MLFLIVLMTVVMVLDCLLLVLLVLMQLPKKEAGAGLAFGGGAADALFGAGSGNPLTKITKYAATVFFVLALLLSVAVSKYHRRGVSRFEGELARPGEAPTMTAPATPSPAATPSTPGSVTMTNASATAATVTSQPPTLVEAVPTNAPATATNPAPAPQ